MIVVNSYLYDWIQTNLENKRTYRTLTCIYILNMTSIMRNEILHSKNIIWRLINIGSGRSLSSVASVFISIPSTMPEKGQIVYWCINLIFSLISWIKYQLKFINKILFDVAFQFWLNLHYNEVILLATNGFIEQHAIKIFGFKYFRK